MTASSCLSQLCEACLPFLSQIDSSECVVRIVYGDRCSPSDVKLKLTMEEMISLGDTVGVLRPCCSASRCIVSNASGEKSSFCGGGIGDCDRVNITGDDASTQISVDDVGQGGGRGGDMNISSAYPDCGYYDVYYYQREYVPVFPMCEFWQYSFKCDTVRSVEDKEDSVVLPTISTASIGVLKVLTREKQRNIRVPLSGLFSNIQHGVDNTGNVCVWPSEPLLAHCILHNSYLRSIITGKTLLELGGGMTGLVGLALALADIPRTVVITDGHPDCVRNQNVCIQMNQELMRKTNSQIETNVSSARLRWSRSDALGDLEQVRGAVSGGSFDIVVASDCLFFKDFHLELLDILLMALGDPGLSDRSDRSDRRDRSDSSDVSAAIASVSSASNKVEQSQLTQLDSTDKHNSVEAGKLGADNAQCPCEANLQDLPLLRRSIEGENHCSATHFAGASSTPECFEGKGQGEGKHVLLMQPRRGGTMETFLNLAKPFFSISVISDYDEEVTTLGRQHLAENDDKSLGYDEDIHFPLLVVMTLLPRLQEFNPL